MSSKYEGHTPEPWDTYDADINGIYIGAPVSGAEHLIAPVAVALDGDGTSRDVLQANARLIADAPTLLRQRDELLAMLHDVQWYSIRSVQVYEAFPQIGELLARIEQEEGAVVSPKDDRPLYHDGLGVFYDDDYARQQQDEAHPAYVWGTRAFGFGLGFVVGAVLWAAWGLPEVWLW